MKRFTAILYPTIEDSRNDTNALVVNYEYTGELLDAQRATPIMHKYAKLKDSKISDDFGEVNWNHTLHLLIGIEEDQMLIAKANDPTS